MRRASRQRQVRLTLVHRACLIVGHEIANGLPEDCSGKRDDTGHSIFGYVAPSGQLCSRQPAVVPPASEGGFALKFQTLIELSLLLRSGGRSTIFHRPLCRKFCKFCTTANIQLRHVACSSNTCRLEDR